jgi:Na+/H+ antiporter NhaC
MIGAAMLAIFAVCAALMYARRMPALLAVPLMAIGFAAVAGAGFAGVGHVIVDGSVRLAPVFVTVIFGALLSRVTISTGIAETIVKYAAEFGGDRPALLALTLCGAVALLFTSLTGLGAIIMVGSIVLPIMMTIGIPRRTAGTLFLLSFALGFIFNISQWKFYTTTFGVERAQLQPFAYALAAIDLAVLLVFAFIQFRTTRGYATWALEIEEPARKRVPLVALFTPILPIVLYFAFGMNPIVAFSIAALYGTLTTRPSATIEILVASAIRGVEDVAPAVLLFMAIGMLLATTDLPQTKAALAPIVAALAPRSPLAYVVAFGLLSPLALYRGPLNPFGVGIAVYAVLAGLGVFPPVILVAAIMAVVQVQNVCDPTNTQNVWVGNFTGVPVDAITKMTLPYQVAVATLATIAVVTLGSSLFGTAPFAGAALSAAAATPPTEPPGLYAPPEAARTLAVAAADDAPSMAGADAIYREIAGGWKDLKALRLATIPPERDCASVPYAALLIVRTTAIQGPMAPTFDMGLELNDCADWPVDQWHVQRDGLPQTNSAAQAGLGTLFRFRTWMLENPALSLELFTRGIAYLPGSTPTYFYTLFKTNDGEMRAFVRPGGPAYASGLRTGDVVVKLDGKFWWEYGTFQTQRRAYDGQPHVFEVTRQKQTLTIALGAPFNG